MNKFYINWFQTMQWCENNPEKLAAIITPKGIFEIKFKISTKEKYNFEGIDSDWMSKYYIQ